MLSALIAYVAVILFTRLNGLRSFSKMSSYDFAMTVAIGSMIAATVVNKKIMWLEGTVGLGTIYLLQHAASRMRLWFNWFEEAVDNTPVLLMVNGTILEENLKKNKITSEDLYAKLREANVLKLEQVQAVILETTGSISVLHAEDPHTKIDMEILGGVKGFQPDKNKKP